MQNKERNRFYSFFTLNLLMFFTVLQARNKDKYDEYSQICLAITTLLQMQRKAEPKMFVFISGGM